MPIIVQFVIVIFAVSLLAIGISAAMEALSSRAKARAMRTQGCDANDHDIGNTDHVEVGPLCLKCGRSLESIRAALDAATQAKNGR